MSSEIKLWHLAFEEPPANAYILIMCATGEYGLRYDVEYTPHIEHWGHYAHYHSVVAWCSIADIHKCGIAVPEITDAIHFELQRNLDDCKAVLSKHIGSTFYQTYATNAEWLLSLVKILAELEEGFGGGMNELIDRIDSNRVTLENKISDFENELDRKRYRNGNYGKYVTKLRLLKKALNRMEQAEELLKGLKGF